MIEQRAPDAAQKPSVHFFWGDDTVAIKHGLFDGLLQVGDEAGPAVMVESHIDFLGCEQVVQCEIPDPALRIGVARQLMTTLGRGIVILELDSRDDVVRIPIEPRASAMARLVILLRGPFIPPDSVVFPPHVRRRRLGGERGEIGRAISGMLEGRPDA